MLKYLLIFLFLTKASAGFSQDSVWVKQDSTSYELYALILDTLAHGDHKVVIRQTCKTQDYTPPAGLKLSIKDSFPSRYKVKILSDKEYNYIFQKQKGWDTFHKKLGGCLFGFSPVLYEDKEHTKAEIYVDLTRGDLDGEGLEIELILSGGKWKIASINETWVA